jgi:transcriptional regulator with XRE-family HTH domain
MTPAAKTGTVRLRRLGDQLRALRRQRGLTLDEVAEATKISKSTLIRLEKARAQGRPQRRTIGTLLAYYEVSGAIRYELLDLLDHADDTEWMQPLRGQLPAPYGVFMDLEHAASNLSVYELFVTPGLLQTEAYAVAHARGALLQATNADVEMRVQARMQRREAFLRSNQKLSAIMTEAGLRFQVGGPAVACEQLAFLLRLQEAHRDITLQVIPASAGAHPAMTSGFTILDFDEDPSLVYLENPGGNVFLEANTELRTFRQIYGRLKQLALSPANTNRLIEELIREIQRRERGGASGSGNGSVEKEQALGRTGGVSGNGQSTRRVDRNAR